MNSAHYQLYAATNWPDYSRHQRASPAQLLDPGSEPGQRLGCGSPSGRSRILRGGYSSETRTRSPLAPSRHSARQVGPFSAGKVALLRFGQPLGRLRATSSVRRVNPGVHQDVDSKAIVA